MSWKGFEELENMENIEGINWWEMGFGIILI
jgi:hypothetical protein